MFYCTEVSALSAIHGSERIFMRNIATYFCSAISQHKLLSL
jgi:hypothetical protein